MYLLAFSWKIVGQRPVCLQQIGLGDGSCLDFFSRLSCLAGSRPAIICIWYTVDFQEAPAVREFEK